MRQGTLQQADILELIADPLLQPLHGGGKLADSENTIMIETLPATGLRIS
jgi:hypothetical protein